MGKPLAMHRISSRRGAHHARNKLYIWAVFFWIEGKGRKQTVSGRQEVFFDIRFRSSVRASVRTAGDHVLLVASPALHETAKGQGSLKKHL